MRKQRYSDLANKLKPYMRQAAPALIIAGGSGGDGGGPHAHSFEELSGELLEEQALWVVEGLAGLKPHNITDPVFHNVIGSQYSVVGLTATDSIGLLTSTPNGSANPNTLLRSGGSGELAIGELTASTVARLGALTDPAMAGFAHAAALATPAIEQASDGGTKLGAAAEQSIDFWVDESRYAALSGNELRLFPDTRLQTDNFVSQLTGWRHTYAGELDTRFIQADQLKIRRLIADLQQALAGSQIISKSVTTLAQMFTAPRPGGSVFLYVDDLPSAEGMDVFEDGDTVRVSKSSRAGGGLSVTDCWGVVTDYFDEADKKQRWFFTRSGDFGLEVPTMTGPLQTANDNDTTLTVTKVTGTDIGNLSIACVLVESTTVVTTPPEDWETITTATVTGMRATIYKKITGGSEPATYSWTHDNNVDSMVILLNYTNQDPDAAVAAYISNPNDSTAAFSVIKSLTPVSDTDLYLAFVAVRANRNPIVQPDGWSLLTTGTAGGNTLAAMTTLVDGYAGLPFGDVSAALTGGTARTISFTIDIIPKPIPLDFETGFMTIGDTVAPGAFVLDYGVSGNGWHEITAIDGIYGSNSPYSRVVSWEGHPATGAIVRTQDGNLNGIFGEGPEWGFYAGDGASDIDAYLRLSNIDSRFNNIALGMFHDGERRFLLTPSSGIDIQAPSSFLGDFHSINFSPIVGSGNSYGRIYNLVTNAGLNDQLSTLYLEAVATGLLSEQQARVALLASGGGGALETGEISVTVDHNGGDTLGVATIKAPTSIELKTLNTLRAIVTSDGYVGIGAAAPDGLQVGATVGETARGVDNVRIGVVSGAPRIIFEDAGAAQWQIDNFSGALRFFNPGAVKMSLDTGGNLSVAGKVVSPSYQPGAGISMADNTAQSLSNWTAITNGLIFVINSTNGISAIFQVRGGINTVNEVSDIFVAYSHTKDTASSINVYYDGGYKIQNKFGGTITIYVAAFGV